MASRGRTAGTLAALALLALAALAVAPLVGIERVPWSAVVDPTPGDKAAVILWGLRVPRVLVAFLAGAGLGTAGLAFQAMFRNPLATPFTLGVASGASLGAALYVKLGLALVFLGVTGTSLAAFAGALGAMALVYGLTRLRRGFSIATMLLAGVAVSFTCSAVILLLQYLADFTQSYRILRWLMGGLEVAGFDAALGLLPLVAVGIAVVALLTRELNLLTTGDELAQARGVDLRGTRQVLFLATSVMVGGVVAECGPIGFVGMMAPHICRMLVGADHRALLPATALFGGAFLVICDTIARVVIAPAEIPVGVITSLLGGPFFLWLLLGGSLRRAGYVEER